MQKSRTSLVIFVAITLTTLYAVPAFSATRYVDGNAVGANNGTSWADAFNYVQDGIAAASNGDMVWVAQGTYNPKAAGRPVAILKDGVSVYGGFVGIETNLIERDPVLNPTILDGQNLIPIVTVGASNARLDGFTISNSIGTNLHGGGLYIYAKAGMVIENCIFTGNGATYGGAINSKFSTISVVNCVFDGNSSIDGAAIYNFQTAASITGSDFVVNDATDSGGAIYNYDADGTVVDDCLIAGNSAIQGGGIYNYSAIVDVTASIFDGNAASQSGGGIYNNASDVDVVNCLFTDNVAAHWGGGIQDYISTSNITNCTFAGNAANYGGAVGDYQAPASNITNCILWGDTAGVGGKEIARRTIYPTVTYSDVQGGWMGAGNKNSDPLFVGGGDYHFLEGSPCIETGILLGAPSIDLDGNPRPSGNTADMGVYEQMFICSDGIDNDGDTLADFPDDPGCSNLTDISELGVNECDDGIDNDNDTFIDWPDDPDCTDINGDMEQGFAKGAIALGDSHTCAITPTGGVKCWGYNYYGQIGDNSTTQRHLPVDVVGLSSGVLKIAAGGDHSCVLTSAGGVKCWGDNYYGQLGDNSRTKRLTPVNVVGLTSGVVEIAAGLDHTCALTSTGTVKCWGYNNNGQLGDNSTTERWAPVDVVGLTSGVVKISTGYYHSCAVTEAGGVKCWGYNDYGQVGDNTTTIRYTPVEVVGLSSGVNDVVSGGYHTCAQTATGGVKCWGWNFYGQLGDNSTSNRYTPVDVVGLSSGVVGIATGMMHTCVATETGGLKCWGNNLYGQLGDNSMSHRWTPVDVVGLSSGIVDIATGEYHSCAVISTGVIKCWGSSCNGEIGDGGNAGTHLTPVAVSNLSSDIDILAAGDVHTCALTSGGGVKCWGANSSGAVGDNSYTDRYTPVDVTGLSSGVIEIAAGAQHTCALTSTGGVKCWGYNYYGQLGNNSTTNQKTPVDVVGLASGVIEIAAGDYNTCAVLSGGAVKCWGRNNFGQLGDNSYNNRYTPVDVVGLSTGAIKIAAGDSHSCAVTSTGGVKCWGYNYYGQLGNNSTAQSKIPVDVVGLSSWIIEVTAGDRFTCVLTSTGGVKCWGWNSYGQLGDNSYSNHYTPVDVVGLSSGAADITAGDSHACAVTSVGGIKCWGWNNEGQLGDNSQAERRAPVDVVGLSSAMVEISAEGSHTCAVTSTGGVKCWGYNGWGQLGIGEWWRTTPVDVVWP